MSISVAGLENFSQSHSRSEKQNLERQLLPIPWKYNGVEGAALQNSVIVTLLLWDEGEKYFPDFPFYAFIITAALNFAIGKKN